MKQHDTDTIRNVAIYIRYSTEEQRTNSYSEETQQDECLRKLTDTYGPGPFSTRIFKDLAVSGAVGLNTTDTPTTVYRQGLTDLLNAIADGEVYLLVCYAQDRLARDEYLWHYINSTVFQKYRIPVLFARDGHDVLSEEGQMLASFHAMVSSIERRKISKNIKAAAKRRAAEGYFVGPPPYGWQWDPDQERRPRERRRIVRNEAQGAVLLEIREKFMAGWPTMAIVRDLHDRGIHSPGGGLRWSAPCVTNVLHNPLHAGLIGLKDELYPGQHAALRYWSAEDRDVIVQRLAERSAQRVKVPTVEKFLLCGVLYCGHCGRRLVGGRESRKTSRLYRCAAPRTNGEHRFRRNGTYEGLRECPGVWRSADLLENAVLDVVSQLAHSVAVQSAAREQLDAALTAEDTSIKHELATVDQELEHMGKGFSRLFNLLDKGSITEDEFGVENQQRRAQESRLRERRDTLNQQLQQRRSRQMQKERALSLLSNFDELWQKMSQAERRQLLLEVDPHMTLTRDGGDMVLTIAPAFGEPVQRRFAMGRRTPVSDRRPDAPLTLRQMALLCSWQNGLSVKDIAEQWDVGAANVRRLSLTIRNNLGVDDLDAAVELVRDRLDRYRGTLPMTGRCKQRPRPNGSPLSDPLLAVLRLMAEGKGCVEIAETLGKDKSTVSRQMKQIVQKLEVNNQQEAIQKAGEMKLMR